MTIVMKSEQNPTDVEDALEALGIVEDLNALVDANQIKVVLDDEGTPRLYPV